MRRGSSTTVLLDIDIPEVADYYLSTKRGWTSCSLNCESFLQLLIHRLNSVTGIRPQCATSFASF